MQFSGDIINFTISYKMPAMFIEIFGLLGFKPIPECATLDSCVSDPGRICDFIY